MSIGFKDNILKFYDLIYFIVIYFIIKGSLVYIRKSI